MLPHRQTRPRRARRNAIKVETLRLGEGGQKRLFAAMPHLRTSQSPFARVLDDNQHRRLRRPEAPAVSSSSIATLNQLAKAACPIAALFCLSDKPARPIGSLEVSMGESNSSKEASLAFTSSAINGMAESTANT